MPKAYVDPTSLLSLVVGVLDSQDEMGSGYYRSLVEDYGLMTVK